MFHGTLAADPRLPDPPVPHLGTEAVDPTGNEMFQALERI